MRKLGVKNKLLTSEPPKNKDAFYGVAIKDSDADDKASQGRTPRGSKSKGKTLAHHRCVKERSRIVGEKCS